MVGSDGSDNLSFCCFGCTCCRPSCHPELLVLVVLLPFFFFPLGCNGSPFFPPPGNVMLVGERLYCRLVYSAPVLSSVFLPPWSSSRCAHLGHAHFGREGRGNLAEKETGLGGVGSGNGRQGWVELMGKNMVDGNRREAGFQVNTIVSPVVARRDQRQVVKAKGASSLSQRARESIHSTFRERGRGEMGVKEKRSAGLRGFMCTSYACASRNMGPSASFALASLLCRRWLLCVRKSI
ncbi:hypothetical protein LZ30DRAFT_219549 [Colletotrichum cereale]|nr:hypothetical protein LZ30DRAFT_219549 [Colletotrichum cereale]